MDSNNRPILLGTHDGNFHGDDVLAMAILTTLYPHHQIIRTRDPDILDLCDVLIDVGGVYDHFIKRYDHHMPNPPMGKHRHLMSSAGLIWQHYAKDYLLAIGMPKSFVYKNKTIDLIEEIERRIHTRWIVPIDRLDNGLAQGFTAISEVVKAMRPTNPQKSRDSFNKAFVDAVGMVSHLFKRTCFHTADYVNTKTIFLAEDKKILDGGRVVVSAHPVHDVKSFIDSDVHFVVCPTLDYEGSDRGFVIRPVQDIASKQFKTLFPNDVLGLTSLDITSRLNIEGISYIHHAGFMALAQDEESAIALCHYLLSSNQR